MEPYRIVAVLDRSELSQLVLEHALDQARRHDTPEIYFLSVVEDPHASLDELKEWLTAQVLDEVDVFRGIHPDWTGHVDVVRGQPIREIAAFVRSVRADLLVVGASPDVGRIAMAAGIPVLVMSLEEPNLETGICPDCAAIRLSTHGERLFCDAHASDHVTLDLPSPTFASGGGPML
jgi:nucleotide-binding universal stress UspA family protein